MRVGLLFPTLDIGSDFGGIRDYIETIEGLGYSHLLVPDHVMGAGLATRPDWNGPYNYNNPFHEPFTLFGFIAGVTKKLEMASGVLILPQRQTVLVAKQAAQIDVMSKGRLRLGVGIGWNTVEYDCLGKNFHDRGKRMEEQINLLRALWGNELVTFKGQYEQVVDAGINPLPLKRNIPLWVGAEARPALQRAARLADGWFPMFAPGEKGAVKIDRMKTYLKEANRGVADHGPQFGMEPFVHAGRGFSSNVPAPEKDAQFRSSNPGPQEWAKEAEWWRAHGATHISLNAMNADAQGAKAHIEIAAKFANAMGLARI
ncbi:MAG TPA: LLM class F420-dependent oxidoreductase [Alphaproteobacteria bacterium]|nr:LLM class F420-dependent oxidoreductase [Alphaproteobacteria bacterium]